MPTPASNASEGMLHRFRRHFWQPPRAHGDVIEDRTVSFLELFFDLVYVVLIGRAAHALAHHVGWRETVEFAVVFGLIWIAWLNGTLYHELHAREDGRSRFFIFVQMLVLAVLAVFAGDAAGAGGAGFAVAYTVLLAVLTWLWFTVRLVDDDAYEEMTRRYLIGMAIAIVVMAASAFLEPPTRMIVWGLLVVLTLLSYFRISSDDQTPVMSVTESMVERFGLFTIIVLGEVVVGVVGGMSEHPDELRTLATGLIGLTIGFGLWWTYFDFVGRRLPRARRASLVPWMLGHYPLALAIASSGAAMVSLVEHAGDTHASEATVWLLAASVALMFLAMIVVMRTLADYEPQVGVYRPLSIALLLAALAALAVGWWQPAPLTLVLALAALPAVVWWFAVDRWLRTRHAGETLSQGASAP